MKCCLESGRPLTHSLCRTATPHPLRTQITNIRMVKDVMREASVLYAELVQVGVGLWKGRSGLGAQLVKLLRGWRLDSECVPLWPSTDPPCFGPHPLQMGAVMRYIDCGGG